MNQAQMRETVKVIWNNASAAERAALVTLPVIAFELFCLAIFLGWVAFS